MIEAEDGKAVEREVKSPELAILWLWKTHNVANRRLSGDLTDDRAFPKEIFPNREHCSHCYDEQKLGSDLW
jgi:thiol oxidase